MACLSVASSPSSTLPFTLLGFVPLLGYSYTRLSQLVPYYCPPCRLSCCAHNTAVCFASRLCLSARTLLPPFGWPRPPSPPSCGFPHGRPLGDARAWYCTASLSGLRVLGFGSIYGSMK